MLEKIEEKIVKLLRSENSRDRNEGCKLMISAYKSKVSSWVKKQKGNTDPEDVWQSASILMVLAIQSGKYQIQANTQMYTYFHRIVQAAWIRLSNNTVEFESLENIHDLKEQNHNEFKPDIVTELNQKKELISYCFEKLDYKGQEILKAVVYEGKKIQEVVDELELKNENNAKQKFFTSKNKLIACLKKKLGYGNEL